MKRKILNAIKIIFSLVFITISITLLITIIHEKEIGGISINDDKNTSSKKTQEIPIPDRIIYKNKNNDYKIIYPSTDEYRTIYGELEKRKEVDINGIVYTKDKIDEMQENSAFIELDYNTKSKNYIVILNEEFGIIRRNDTGGQVIQNKLENKEKMFEEIEKITKDIRSEMNFKEYHNYISTNKIEKVPDDFLNLETKNNGIYQKIIENDKEEYNRILEELNFQTTGVINLDFDKQNVIITISKYEVTNITTNIGNIKYEFGKLLDEYEVSVLQVSKLVNEKCIYQDVNLKQSNIDMYYENDNPDGIDYYIENGKYYTTLNHTKAEIISDKNAIQIAENEAKDEKYQYQEWKSEFYAPVSSNEDNSAELILGLTEIEKLSQWNDKWKREETDNKLMWKIRLFDKNDPLTSLYIYVNALNGNIVGAGDSSD